MASPTSVKKRSHLGLFVPLLIGLLLVGAWSAWWYIAGTRIHQGVDEWIAARAEEGVDIAYSARSFGGYPFRFEMHFDDPVVNDHVRNLSWEGERIEFVMQAWNLQHLIGRLPGHHVVTGPDGIRNSLDFTGEAAFSLSWTDAGMRRFGFQSGEADALIGGVLYQVGDLSLNLAPRPESPQDMMVALQWQRIGLEEAPREAPYLGTELGPSRLIGEVRGFFPAHDRAVTQPENPMAAFLETGGGIEVAQLLLDWGPLELGAKADLDFTGGQGDGTISLRLDNVEELRVAMSETGHWTQQEQILVGTLEFASRNGGFLTLSVVDGQIFAGPVAIGYLPGPRL